jgi:hypothetical protein
MRKETGRRSVIVSIALMVLLLSTIPASFAESNIPASVAESEREIGINISYAGFAHFYNIRIDPDGANGRYEEGWLQIDFYHVIWSRSGQRDFDVAQYVVWSFDNLLQSEFPVAVLTLCESTPDCQLLSRALGAGEPYVVDISKTPELLRIQKTLNGLTARIASQLVPDSHPFKQVLPSGTIVFKKVAQGEKEAVRTILPLLDTGYVLMQNYRISKATASFDNGPVASEAWLTNAAFTAIVSVRR